MSLFLVASTGRLSVSKESFPGPLGSDPWVHRPNDPKYEEMWQLFSHLPIDHLKRFRAGHLASALTAQAVRDRQQQLSIAEIDREHAILIGATPPSSMRAKGNVIHRMSPLRRLWRMMPMKLLPRERRSERRIRAPDSRAW